MQRSTLQEPQALPFDPSHLTSHTSSDQPKTSVHPSHSVNLISQAMTDHVINHIEEEIINDKMTISQKEHIDLISNKPPMDSFKLAAIVRRRNELQSQMKRLQYEERRVKLDQSRSRSPLSKSAEKKERSHITPEETHKIKKVLEGQKLFEEANKEKNKILQAKIRELELKEIEQMKKKMSEKCKIKQKQIARNLQKLQQRKQERIRKLQQMNKKYEQVKKQHCLFEDMQQNGRKLQQSQQQRAKSIKEQRKREKLFSIEEINSHQQKYHEIIEYKERERKRREKQERRTKSQLQKQVLSQYSPSRFLLTIFQQEQMKKAEHEMKAKQYKTFNEKRTSYAESIRIEHKTALPLHPNPVSPMSLNSTRSKSLSSMQIIEKGNAYMKQIHNSISQADIQKNKSKIKLKPKPQAQKKYEDYLQEQKKLRASRQSKDNPQNTIKQRKQLNALMKKPQPLPQKLYFAKLIARKLDDRVGNNVNLMVESIIAKLDIINQFS